MTYTCPRCALGQLRPTRSAYVRRWGHLLIVQPNFPLWRCDSCGYSRYDRLALTRVEYLLGPENDLELFKESRTSRRADGPAESGPSRWSL